MDTNGGPAHLQHAIRFLREHWLEVDKVTKGTQGVNLYLAVPRYPRIAVLVTGGYFAERQILSRLDTAALRHLRTFARTRSLKAVHIESLVNSAGDSEVLDAHLIP